MIGKRDLDEELREPGGAQPVGAIVTIAVRATSRLEFSGECMTLSRSGLSRPGTIAE
jgi:hypothetical protein